MRIASVCNYPQINSVGGGQVPAVAFKEWCDIFSVDCDLVSIFDKPIEELNTMIPNIKIVRDEDCLNEYDFIFFSSIGDIDYKKIKTKYSLMLHAEFDKTLYGEERSWIAIKNSEFVVVIGYDYWQTDKEEFFWYPCTLPKYLLTEEDILDLREVDEINLLYSARLSTWKNSALLAAYTHLNDYKKCIKNTVVYGEANNEYYGESIKRMNPEWTKNKGIYNIYDFESTRLRHKNFSLFWDVNGSDEYTVYLKRMNLSAFESLKFGLVPVVDSNAVPYDIKYSCIDYRGLTNFINNMDLNQFNNFRKICLSQIQKSKFGFSGVSKQISQILYKITGQNYG